MSREKRRIGMGEDRTYYIVRTSHKTDVDRCYAKLNDCGNYVADVSREWASEMKREKAYEIAGLKEGLAIVKVTVTKKRFRVVCS